MIWPITPEAKTARVVARKDLLKNILFLFGALDYGRGLNGCKMLCFLIECSIASGECPWRGFKYY